MRKTASNTTASKHTAKGRRGKRTAPISSATSSRITEQTLEFELLRSAMYHDMREHWYGLINRTFIFFTLVLGTSTVAAFGASYPLYGKIAGLMIAVISALTLVWDFSGRSKVHFDLKRRFYTLLSEFQSGVTAEEINASMTLIYADEPPTMHSVNALAHNAAGRSIFGNDFKSVRVGIIARYAKNIWPFRADKFRDA